MPGADVGVYKYGSNGVTGGALARLVGVDVNANTVRVEMRDGEEKELPAHAVFDPKLLNLVVGHTPRRKKKRTPRGPQGVHLPKVQKEQNVEAAAPDETFGGLSDIQLPKPCTASWDSRREENLKFQKINGPVAAGTFVSEKHSATETLAEMHHLLSRPEPPAGPPCDAKSFKNALLKKFRCLGTAWKHMDTNSDGSLSFLEFTRACRHIQFVGNLKQIFKELTLGEDLLRPELIDADLPAKIEALRLKKAQDSKRKEESPNLQKSMTEKLGYSDSKYSSRPDFNHGRRGSNAETLGEVHLLLTRPVAREVMQGDAKSFKTAMIQRFGNLQRAWDVMDANGNGLVEFSEFCRMCRMLPFTGKLKQVFEDICGGEDAIRPEDLHEDLPDELEKSSSARQIQRELTLTGGGKNFGIKDVARKTAGEIHFLILQKPAPPSGPPDDARAFKACLRKKFGRLGPAWVKIDVNNDGLLQYHEFVRACRDIKFNGNFKKIFQELTGGEECLRPALLDPHLPAELEHIQKYGLDLRDQY